VKKKREQEGAAYQALFFNQKTINGEVYWKPKENIKLSPEYFENIKELVSEQRAKEIEEESQLGIPTKYGSKSNLKDEPANLRNSRGSDKKKGKHDGNEDEENTGNGQEDENCRIS